MQTCSFGCPEKMPDFPSKTYPVVPFGRTGGADAPFPLPTDLTDKTDQTDQAFRSAVTSRSDKSKPLTCSAFPEKRQFRFENMKTCVIFPSEGVENIMVKYGLFLCCFLCLILICSYGKRKISEAEKEKLLSLYPKLYFAGDPTRIDAMSNQILSAVSKDNPDMDLQFLLIHAYTAKAFAANLRKDKKQAVKYLETADTLLSSLKHSFYKLKSKCDIYFVYYQIQKDHPDQSEKWLVKLEKLIDQEMSAYEFKYGSDEYRRFLYSRYGENSLLRANYLINHKNDCAAAERILLESLKKQEKWAGNEAFSSQMYGYDLLSEIYFRKMDEASCCLYAEKAIRLAVRLDQFPLYAPDHYYILKMKQQKYESALSCCRQILDIRSVKKSRMSHIRKDFLIKASDACKKMKDFKNSEYYLSQADKLASLLETDNKK